MIAQPLLKRRRQMLVVLALVGLIVYNFFIKKALPSNANSLIKPQVNPIGDDIKDGTVGEGKVNEGSPKEEVKGDEGVKEETTRSRLEAKTLRKINDYTIFFEGLEDYKPKSPSLKNSERKAPEKFADSDDFLMSKEFLENVLEIPASTVSELKILHQKYIDVYMKRLLETHKISTFGNVVASDPNWSTYQGSAGYVLVGGTQYSWLSYLVIRQIRATGAQLPIELFIPDEEEYEEEFCERLLPRFNARCIMLNKELTTDLRTRFDTGKYQFKLLALLSSSFENVIYVDSDNYPARNIDPILLSELYQQKNMILWPDAWARTTNPKYYEIAGIDVKEKKVRYSRYDYKQAETKGWSEVKPLREYNFKNSWFHDFEGTLPDPTSETGAFIINKTSHLKTLLLCLYYNMFGPNHYWPLLTQGSAGEGDKETFIAAAHVMKEPWFQTLKTFKWVGYFSELKQKFDSKSLGQYDPVQSLTDNPDIHIAFMHLSYPKYFPNWLIDNQELYSQDLGTHIRMYEDSYENIGYDFDLRVLQFFTQALCPNYYDANTGLSIDGENISKDKEYMGKYLRYVAADEQTEIERCNNVFIPHLEWLKKTTKYPKNLVFKDADTT